MMEENGLYDDAKGSREGSGSGAGSACASGHNNACGLGHGFCSGEYGRSNYGTGHPGHASANGDYKGDSGQKNSFGNDILTILFRNRSNKGVFVINE